MKIQEILKKFEKRWAHLKPPADDPLKTGYFSGGDYPQIIDDIKSLLSETEKTVREDERTEIWKWCGENSWVQNDGLTEKGEVRVIDCDELADYWRKNERSIK